MNEVICVKWLRHALAWIVLLLMALLAPGLPGWLPPAPEDMVAETYGQWAGVLRLWVDTGWQPGSGSMQGWLNKAISRFERRNQGVYVQVQPVAASVLRDFASGEINPPDMILFAPGMITSADNLLALDAREGLLPALRDVGERDGRLYAAPVAMGGYAWAINTRLLSGAPVGEISLPAPTKKRETTYLIQAPRDGEYVSWSGALLYLLLHSPESELEPAPHALAGEGIDLGLTAPAPEPTPEAEAPAPVRQLVLSIPQALGKDFRQVSSAVSDFRGGRAAAIPVSQLEIKQLSQLSEQGRVPEWAAVPSLAAFTDQLAMLAIVDVPRTNQQARQALCLKLLDLLLSDESQKALSSIWALRVTEGEALYQAQQPMAVLERSYQGAIACPNAFDNTFRQRLQERFASQLAAPN